MRGDKLRLKLSGRRPNGDDSIRVVPVRHRGRWLAAAIVLLLVAMLAHSLFFSHVLVAGSTKPRERFEWHVVDHYFLSSEVLQGLVTTLELTVVAMAIGLVLGMSLAVMRLSPNPIVSGTAWAYIWFFRGTPVYVQLLFWSALYYIFPSITLGVPFGPAIVHIDVNALSGFWIGCIGLGLNEGAYMSEIARAGIVSVEEGQTEAALSIGMSRLMALRLIVFPQAMRVIVPPAGNETISMLKTSSLVSVIPVTELTYTVQQIAASNYKTVPLYMVASLWYLIVTTVMMVGQYYLERYYARGSARTLPPTPMQRLRRGLLIRPGNSGYGRFPAIVGDQEWLGPPGGPGQGLR